MGKRQRWQEWKSCIPYKCWSTRRAPLEQTDKLCGEEDEELRSTRTLTTGQAPLEQTGKLCGEEDEELRSTRTLAYLQGDLAPGQTGYLFREEAEEAGLSAEHHYVRPANCVEEEEEELVYFTHARGPTCRGPWTAWKAR